MDSSKERGEKVDIRGFIREGGGGSFKSFVLFVFLPRLGVLGWGAWRGKLE